ncbi:MAG: isoprenylcysteine carboxylmethyltransferase family protein [Candidatus Omnitrophica bacterium]|nr:isoprenylcysteine carboxylmethyltransferase family protein [Candidatus Omnitrophota bacterium]
MNIKERFKRWSKLRFAIMYPLGVFVVLFSNSDDRSIMASIWFIIAGLLLRLWANSYAIKMDRLTTSGPYAFVRHPLYLGTMLIIIGFVIMLKIYYIGVLFVILIAAVYYDTIKKEEAMLEIKFKEAYLRYKGKVRAMLPTLSAYVGGEKWPFSFKRLINSQEYKPFLWVIILMIAFHLKDEIMIEREAMDAKIWMLFISAFILGMIDILGELARYRKSVLF